jgi:hypothetical protein
LTIKTGVGALVNRLVGTFKAATLYKEEGISIRFSSEAGTGCLEG